MWLSSCVCFLGRRLCQLWLSLPIFSIEIPRVKNKSSLILHNGDWSVRDSAYSGCFVFPLRSDAEVQQESMWLQWHPPQNKRDLGSCYWKIPKGFLQPKGKKQTEKESSAGRGAEGSVISAKRAWPLTLQSLTKRQDAYISRTAALFTPVLMVLLDYQQKI